MKVALIGASGNVGSRILTELLNRGHEVTGIVRHPEKLQRHERLAAKRGDFNDEAGLAPLLAGHDAVISAVRFQSANPQSLIGAVKKAGVKRLLVVGGAGSLEVSPGVQLVDTPDFPEAYKPEALAGRVANRVADADAARLRAVVHDHRDHPPVVGGPVGIAAADGLSAPGGVRADASPVHVKPCLTLVTPRRSR